MPGPTRKTRTNTRLKTCFSCRKRRDGPICNPKPDCRKSVRWLTARWTRLKRIIRRWRDVLPKVFARGNLDPTNLGGLIDLISNIALGDAKARSADVLGHVFEYFLGEFALAEGKKGGQFYTPRSVVNCWWRCWNPTKAACSTPAAAPAACLCNRKSLWPTIRDG